MGMGVAWGRLERETDSCNIQARTPWTGVFVQRGRKQSKTYLHLYTHLHKTVTLEYVFPAAKPNLTGTWFSFPHPCLRAAQTNTHLHAHSRHWTPEHLPGPHDKPEGPVFLPDEEPDAHRDGGAYPSFALGAKTHGVDGTRQPGSGWTAGGSPARRGFTLCAASVHRRTHCLIRFRPPAGLPRYCCWGSTGRASSPTLICEFPKLAGRCFSRVYAHGLEMLRGRARASSSHQTPPDRSPKRTYPFMSRTDRSTAAPQPRRVSARLVRVKRLRPHLLTACGTARLCACAA